MTLGDFRNIAQGVQAVVGTIILVLGAIGSYLFFIQRRQRYPRAEIELIVTKTHLLDGMKLVRITVVLKNVGEILILIDRGFARLLQVSPCDGTIHRCLREGASAFPAGQSKAPWPQLDKRTFNSNPACAIKPGESEEIYFDFFVASEIKAVFAYSYISNLTFKHRELGWGRSTFIDLADDGFNPEWSRDGKRSNT